MRVLFVADVVGADAAAWLASRLGALRTAYELDVVIVNPDNTAISGPSYLTGSGVDAEAVARLFAAGTDLISPGTHIFDTSDASALLARPGVIRAANLPAGTPGTGIATFEVRGERLTVIQLADVGPGLLDASTFPAPARSALEAWEAQDLPGPVLVHLLFDNGYNAQRFALALDGSAAAVLGTLPHTPSLDLEVLPGGTGFVLDVGYTGPGGGLGGFDPDQPIAALRGIDLSQRPPYRLADGPLRLGAVIVDIDQNRTRALTRLSAADVEAAAQTLTTTSGGI
jgi:2',3'-cyclic-nucleotide 2'-phosphodiesterase